MNKTKEEIITIINTSTSLEEIFNVLSSLLKSENKNQLLEVHPFVGETIVKITTGKDSRFSKEEFMKYMTMRRKKE